jgi:AcrR family transcriptional regulator
MLSALWSVSKIAKLIADGKEKNVTEQKRVASSPAPKKRQRLSKKERFDALIATGLKPFGEHPYNALTVEDICAAANTSPPLLQHYFGSKLGYFLAVIRHAVDLLEQTTRPSISDDSFRSMTRLVEVYVSFLLQHYHRNGIEIWVQHGEPVPDVHLLILCSGLQLDHEKSPNDKLRCSVPDSLG